MGVGARNVADSADQGHLDADRVQLVRARRRYQLWQLLRVDCRPEQGTSILIIADHEYLGL